MYRSLLWLIPALVGLGCSSALPSAAQYPAPVASAAQPAVAGRGDSAYARRALEAIRQALRNVDSDRLSEVVESGLELREAGVAARCVDAGGHQATLVCHFGPSASQPVAQGIFWRDDNVWEAQLYPQASLKLAEERATLLGEHGCRLGCSSGVRSARLAASPEGPELLVVVDLGHVSGHRAEEAQLLRRRGGHWEAAWVPDAANWSYGHARVELSTKGTASFQVHASSWMREDPYSGYFSEPESGEHRRFAERWMRKGSGYVLANRREEPTPYSTLVKLVHYLSVGGDEKAAALMVEGLPLDDVRRALAQKPRRQGWSVTRWGDDGFLLDPRGDGKPTVGVRFARDGEDWVLAEIWAPQH